MAAALISCEDVKITRRGRVILDVPSFAVEPGETLAILGQTGAGKSTLLNVLNVTVRPDEGRIFWKGEEIGRKKAGSEARRRMAMAFQTPLLFKGTVFENIAYGLKIRRLPKEERQAKIDRLLELFKISELASANAASLSGGEAHRVSLARALVFEPELILLDEPMASLDPVTKEKLLKDLMGILKELKVTCVYVTHSREEGYMVADRIAVIEQGRIAQIGTAENVFYHPANEDVAAFLGTGNILPGLVAEQNEGLALIELENARSGERIEAVSTAAPGVSVTVCVRPEEVFIEHAAANPSAGSARNRLRGRVSEVMITGPTASVTVDCGFPLRALITRRSLADMKLTTGADVIAGFKATSVHLIEK